MNTSSTTHATHGSRWVAAILISGVGLAGLGYSLATRPTAAPAPVVFVPQQVDTRTSRVETPSAAPPAQGEPPAQAATTRGEDGVVQYEPKPTPEAGLLIDINTASAEQLQLLPGIGPSRARSIIEDRQAMGPFSTIDDLQRIRGIGPATVEGVRPYVHLGRTGDAGG